MADPIFTPEAPAAARPKRKMSNGAKIAIGCGALILLGLGTCGGGMMYCGKALTSAGQTEWADLRKVANDLGTDAGAEAEYTAHPGLAQAYPTAQDFVGAAKLWRTSLEPLPEQMPPLLSGKVSVQSAYNNGQSRLALSYALTAGKHLVGTWKNGQLVDLQLE